MKMPVTLSRIFLLCLQYYRGSSFSKTDRITCKSTTEFQGNWTNFKAPTFQKTQLTHASKNYKFALPLLWQKMLQPVYLIYFYILNIITNTTFSMHLIYFRVKCSFSGMVGVWGLFVLLNKFTGHQLSLTCHMATLGPE